MTNPLPPTDVAEAAICLPFTAPDVTLAQVGGKGLNLAKLAQADFPVPPGFLITTSAYELFVEEAGLAAWIQEQVAAIDLTDADALAAVSERIRARFREQPMPPEAAAAIRRAYRELDDGPVAVRSSATAEDLPDMSFAGQQDTYLNVVGEDALLEAVVACWSSLWTARAMGYRARNGIDQRTVRLAVVVQRMVQSEVSGVLFTANPLTGRRTETVIDATFGLGEALVSGQVEPDHYVVETATGRIIEKRLGAKATVIRSRDGGGVAAETMDRAQEQALTDDQIRELTELGRQVAAFYDFPQDIEWAFAGGKLYLLQSRPITSLFPLPPVGDAEDLHVFISFGAIQGMLDPMTPLGRDVIKAIFAGGGRLFGYETDYRSQKVLWDAAERLWGDLTPMLRHPIGRRLYRWAISGVEPATGAALEQLLEDPRLAVQETSPEAIIRRVTPLVRRLAPVYLAGIRDPNASREALFQRSESFIADYHRRYQSCTTLAQVMPIFEQMIYTPFYTLIPELIPRIGVGYGPLLLLQRFFSRLAQEDPTVDPQMVLTLTRGLPHNVTTEMDLALWEAARRIRDDGEAQSVMQRGDPEELAQAYLAGTLPPVAQRALADFLDRYGARGLGEIDLGRPRWRENPTPVIQSVQSYMAIDNPDAAPDVVFRRGAQAAEQAIDALVATASRLRGPAAGWLVRKLAARVRAMAGLREYPKFTIIRLFGEGRAALLRAGEDLVQRGVLEQADDLVFLHLNELWTLALDAPGDWKRLVRARRAVYEREKRRQPIPRLLVSDGAAFYEGLGAEEAEGEGIIVGSPVSPGVVEGPVRVVFDPHHAQLQPGEILVCPGTDPAWTPLFLAAGGLITEVGGMMTHGSVVAREYGIPAVVGVDRATQRLHTGQRIRLDGSRGRIELLD